MTFYTFFPCQSDGSALSFESFEMADDAHAFNEALVMLDQHSTAAYVTVWSGDRQVFSLPRDLAAMPPATPHHHRPHLGP